MLHSLCANWMHWAVDGVAVVIFLICAVASAKKGFLECFFGLISTIAAVILAFFLMKPLLSWTGGLFGLDGVIENGCIQGLGNIEGFNVLISASDIQADLAAKNMPQFIIDMVVSAVGAQEYPEGTTLAMVAGESLGELATTLISWLAVFILAKLVLRILKGLLTSIAYKIPLMGTLNGLLGFVVGALKGVLIVSGVLAVLALFPNEGMMGFFGECTIVGGLYSHNPINVILSWILV